MILVHVIFMRFNILAIYQSLIFGGVWEQNLTDKMNITYHQTLIITTMQLLESFSIADPITGKNPSKFQISLIMSTGVTVIGLCRCFLNLRGKIT